MRSWSLALCLILLAGCGDVPAPIAPDEIPSAVAPIAPAAVAFGSTEYTDWDAFGETTLRGQRAEVWDAKAALGLPRPFTALLVEMRCIGSVQEGDNQSPQLMAAATFDNGTGNPWEMSGGGNRDCEPAAFDVVANDVDGIGSLKTLQADAPLGNSYTLGANFRIEYAASLFTDGDIPAGYSAWSAPMA